jgi:hypothetical protein
VSLAVVGLIAELTFLISMATMVVKKKVVVMTMHTTAVTSVAMLTPLRANSENPTGDGG